MIRYQEYHPVMTKSRYLVSGTALLVFAMMGSRALSAQETNGAAQGAPATDGVTQGPVTVEKPDPLKRQLSDKEKFAQQKALKGELHGVYKTWLDQDVRWIITDQEMQAFKHLSNDEERDQFIENFWLCCFHDPATTENE